MEEQGYITRAEYREARDDSGLGSHPGHKYRVIRDPFLFDLVQQELIDKYGINTVRNGGLKAYTTIDPELQERAQEAVDSCSVCYPEGGPAAGLASVNPDNGEIVALASTEGYPTRKRIQLRLAGAPPARLLVQDLRPDDGDQAGHRPRHAPTTTAPRRRPSTCPGGGTWTVNNAEPGGGTMSLDDGDLGLGQRRSSPSSTSTSGPENVTQTAHEMGIEAPLESVPAEAIGGLAIGVTPLEMADGYATLASGGIHHDPTAIGRVEFPNGKVDEADARLRRPRAHRGPGLRSDQDPRGRDHRRAPAPATPTWAARAEAGKTGTSEDLSDAWFVGYTPLYSTAVWVGHPQSREETGFGGPTAGPIWRSFMESAAGGRLPRIRRTVEPARTLRPRQRPHLAAPQLLGRIRIQRIRRRRIERRTRRKEEGRRRKQAAPKAKPKPLRKPRPNPPRRRRSPPPAGGGISPRLSPRRGHPAEQRAASRLAGAAGDARRGRRRHADRLPAEVGRAGRLAGRRLPAGDPADLDRLGAAPGPARLGRQRRRLQLLPACRRCTA